MSADTKTVNVLAVLDQHHETLLSAGNFSGEGCWFRDRDEEEIVAGYTRARAAIEDLRLKADNAERALRSLVAAGQAPAGYLQYADDLAAALRAVGGAE